MYTVVGIKEREISPIRFDKNTSGTAITFVMYCVYSYIVNLFCIGKRLQYFFCLCVCLSFCLLTYLRTLRKLEALMPLTEYCQLLDNNDRIYVHIHVYM